MALYFAYGSNMNAAQLQARLAREGHSLLARRRGTASGYRLVFNKRSSEEAWVGYANIEPVLGARVEGTLNEVSDEGLDLLDRIELVPVHYRRISVPVMDWESGKLVSAFTYLGQPEMIDNTVRPTPDYVALLMAGADVLPADYVLGLAAVDCC